MKLKDRDPGDGETIGGDHASLEAERHYARRDLGI